MDIGAYFECKCLAGYESVNDGTQSKQCVHCDADSYKPDVGDQACTTSPQCDFGYEQIAAPTYTAPRQCRECEAGVTYFNQDTSTCDPVTPPCEIGFGEIRAPTKLLDRQCEECGGGVTFYNAETGKCDPVSPECEPGFEQTQAPPQVP